MYDSLMQMGRWFGYRPGYVDLCRFIQQNKFLSGLIISQWQLKKCEMTLMK
jgi:hypothetical protein